MKNEDKTKEELNEEVKALRWLLEHAKTREEERRKEEEDLKGKPELQNLFFDSSPNPIVVVGAEGIVLAANPSCAEKSGRDLHDLVGSSLDDLWPSTAAEKRRVAIRDAIFTGRPVRFEDEGAERYYDVTVTPVSHEPGLAGKVVIFLSDVTERKNLEKALDEAELKYRRTYEMASEGIFQTAPDGHFVMVNNALARMYGYSSPEDFMRSVVAIARQHYVDPPRRAEFLRLLKEDGAVYNFEAQMVRKDRNLIWVSVSARSVRDRRKVLYYEGTATDITTRKRLEAELAHSRKTETMGRLAGGIAHNFSNLLTVIMGNFELLLQRDDLREIDDREIRPIKEALGKASSLCEQLMGLSRRKLTRPVKTNLRTVLSGIEEMLRYLLGGNIAYDMSFDPEARAVDVDPSLVEQMVFILAENARDAMPKGGKLAISLENVSPDMDYRETYGLPHDAPSDEYVALTVADTGRGIPPEMLGHIFEPFFTIKPDGTGLGLSIVHSIVKQCRGYISARSEEKKGTSFTIHFPVFLREDHSEEETSFIPGEAVPFTNATVLVVEDESGILYWVTDVLEGLGYRVLSSFNAEDAVSSLAQLSEPLDLLITDLVLPGISGTDLAAMLKARYPEMKVIYMSGHPDVRSEQADLPRKSPFLAKPFTPLLLLMKVKEVLGTYTEAPRTGRQNS